jgi:hypothetical protein
MKKAAILLTLVLIFVAYLFGYWPEHGRLTASQQEVGALKAQLAEARAQVRMCVLQTRLFELIEKTREKNYGEALKLSSDFFDRVRTEFMQTERPDFKSALNSILQARDSVTAALAKGDGTASDVLSQASAQLRQIMERFQQ